MRSYAVGSEEELQVADFSTSAKSTLHISPVRPFASPNSFAALPHPSSWTTNDHVGLVKCVSQSIPELCNFSLRRLYFRSFRHGLLPGPLGSCHPPPKASVLLRNPPRRDTQTQLPTVHIFSRSCISRNSRDTSRRQRYTTSHAFTRPILDLKTYSRACPSFLGCQ